MPLIDWSYYKRDTLHLAFRLEVHPEAWPKDKFYACAPKYVTLELGIGYRVLWIWVNRDEQAMLRDSPCLALQCVRPSVMRPLRKRSSSRRVRRRTRRTKRS